MIRSFFASISFQDSRNHPRSRRVEKYRRTKRGIIKEVEGMETGHRPRRSLHRIRKNSGCARIEADGIRKSGGRKRGAARDRTCSPSLAKFTFAGERSDRENRNPNWNPLQLGLAKGGGRRRGGPPWRTRQGGSSSPNEKGAVRKLETFSRNRPEYSTE